MNTFRFLKTVTLLAFLVSLLASCTSSYSPDSDSSAQNSIWIDVRSPEEYSADHINGDTNIPVATIDPLMVASQFGKDAEINLYCRSGGRAGRAREILAAAGFTNVTNVGGIDEVRELRNIARSSSAQ